MRVVQASFLRHPSERSAANVLREWPTVLNTARAAQASGLDVHALQAHYTTDVAAGGLVRFTDDVFREIARLQPAVVHVHGLQSRATHQLSRRFPRMCIVVQNRGGTPPPAWKRPVMRWRLRSVKAGLFTARELAAQFGVLPRRAKVLEVIDASADFKPGDGTAARRQTGLYGGPCVLWVGRFRPVKDPLTALRAVQVAAHRLPELQLWCVFQDDTLLEQVTDYLNRDAALAARVHLLGPVPHDQLENYYRAADIFLGCSLREGSGFALIEALACGVVPVVSSIPSFRKITQDGRVGYLAPPGDAAAFAAALVAAAAARRSVDQVRQHFDQYLSYERMGRDLRAAYEAVLS